MHFTFIVFYSFTFILNVLHFCFCLDQHFLRGFFVLENGGVYSSALFSDNVTSLRRQIFYFALMYLLSRLREENKLMQEGMLPSIKPTKIQVVTQVLTCSWRTLRQVSVSLYNFAELLFQLLLSVPLISFISSELCSLDLTQDLVLAPEKDRKARALMIVSIISDCRLWFLLLSHSWTHRPVNTEPLTNLFPGFLRGKKKI